MLEHMFTHFFPEWVLSVSLGQSCKDSTSNFWEQPIVHPTEESTKLSKFSDLFPLSSVKTVFHWEKPFKKSEAKLYGIPEERYKTTFWSLRPDFMVTYKDQLIILLDAKGGEVPSDTWNPPKELSYYRFLTECGQSFMKGFYYIIPEKYKDDCLRCLAKYFPPSQTIHTGFICWENFLSIIDDEMIHLTLDQLIKEMEGLKHLRDWQKAKRL